MRKRITNPNLEKTVATPIKRKKSFGSVTIDHFSPPTGAGLPLAINIHISFEEALKLHLGLGQILGHLNGYDRKTKGGRRSAVNLCLYPGKNRITINEGRTRSPEKTLPADDGKPANA